MLDALGPARLSRDAVLARLTLPLWEIEAWDNGSLVYFDPEMLEAVHLEGEKSHVVGTGALGQLNGRRAVRLGSTPLAPRPAAPAVQGGLDAATNMGGGGFDPGAAAPDMSAAGFDPDAAGFDPNAAGFDPDATGFAPNAAGFDPNAAGFDPDAAGFDPNAVGFDPDAPAFDPNAPGGGLPDLPMGDFDPNAPMG